MNLPDDDPIPEDGVFIGDNWIHPDDYHRSARLSRSGLVTIKRKSPLHFAWQREHPQEPTPSMLLGTAIHAAVLEPDRFADEYVFAPKRWDRTRVSDREAYWQWLITDCGWADGGMTETKRGQPRMAPPKPRDGIKQAIDYDDAEAVLGIVESVQRDSEVMDVLQGPGWTEATCAWSLGRGKLGTAKLRARPDRRWIAGAGPMVADLKSAADASRRAFRNEIANRGLHIQAALYLDGLTAATGIEHHSFVFVIYEKEPPYACAVRPIEAEAIVVGRSEYRMAIDRYLKCAKENRWPGYGFEPTGLPPWYAKVEEYQ